MSTMAQNWFSRKVHSIENPDDVVSYCDLLITIVMVVLASMIFFYTGWFIPSENVVFIKVFKPIFIFFGWGMVTAAWRFLLRFVDQFILFNDKWNRTRFVLWVAGSLVLLVVMLIKIGKVILG